MIPAKFVILILVGGVVFYTLTTIGVAIFVSQNAALYALLSGILGNFTGALFIYLHLAPSSTTTTTTGGTPPTTTETQTKTQ